MATTEGPNGSKLITLEVRVLTWAVSILLTIVITLIGAWANSNSTAIAALEKVNTETRERLATLEAHYKDIDSKLASIDSKLTARPR